jgi:hypothetical protein
MLIFHFQIFEDTVNIIFFLKAICFFISHSRLLRIASFKASSRTELTFADKFLLYQVNRVRLFTQNSSTEDSNQNLNEMTKFTKFLEFEKR